MKRLSELSEEERLRLVNRALDLEKYIQEVKPIIDDVRRRGDEAVIEYTRRIDGVDIASPLLPLEKVRELAQQVDESTRQALDLIINRVREVNEKLLIKTRVVVIGRELIEFRAVPINRVGLYIPRGYVSTLIMLATIARVAGCPEIVVVTPPQSRDQLVSPAFAYVLHRLQVSTVIVANAVAGIAAVAYGTKSVPRVDKLFGPGNMYVQAAKYLVSNTILIDCIEGPTELVVLVGKKSPEDYTKIALDVLAELEHGTASIVVVISESEDMLKTVEKLYEERAKTGKLGQLYTLLVDDLEQAVNFVNEIAPEHVEVYDEALRARKIARKITNAGIVAVNTPCTYMDYSAGVCHVLPTSGFARGRGAITPLDFIKIVPIHEGTTLELVQAGIKVAQLENMKLHEESLRSRL